jgi:hypothetical protein
VFRKGSLAQPMRLLQLRRETSFGVGGWLGFGVVAWFTACIPICLDAFSMAIAGRHTLLSHGLTYKRESQWQV